LKRLSWSDNTGTVGHTMIHAVMCVADMEWLLSMAPEGKFFHTFCPGEGHAKGSWTYSWSTQTGRIENMRRGADYHPDGPFTRGFYFEFPEEGNTPLLVALKLMGMGPRGA